MKRTNLNVSSPGFIADPGSIQREPLGRLVDFDKVNDTYRAFKKTIQTNGATSAGATSITVDALPVDLPLGFILNFGALAPVTVTTSAQANAAATSISVNALSGPIPSGTILNFTGTGEFAVLTADAATGATSLSVEALDATIESGDTATFNGGTKQARLTAAADQGATSLTVDELQFAIPDNATATYGGSGSKIVKAGKVVAALSSGKVIPRDQVTASETSLGILVDTASDGSPIDAATGYGLIIGGIVYEELLPDYSHASWSTWKSELEALGFKFRKFYDSRAS